MSTVRVVTIRNAIHGALQLQLKTCERDTVNKRGTHRADKGTLRSGALRFY